MAPNGTRRTARRQRGQVLTEYAIMLVLCIFIAISLAGLLYYFSSYGNRLVDMVCLGCP